REGGQLDRVARPFVECPRWAGWRTRKFPRTAVARKKDREKWTPRTPGRTALHVIGLNYPVAIFVRQRFAGHMVLRPAAQRHHAVAPPDGDHHHTGERAPRPSVQ